MKILLDENLPKKLKRDLTEHEVFTVREQGWNGKKNGELLALMEQEQFDVLMTFDKNLQHQQNFAKYDLCVIVLSARSNSYLVLQSLMSQVQTTLQSSYMQGVVVIQE